MVSEPVNAWLIVTGGAAQGDSNPAMFSRRRKAANSSWTSGAGLIGVGVVPAAVVIPTSPSSSLTTWAGRPRIVAIGDTAAGALSVVLTAAVLTIAALTVAPAARTAVVAGVCAAIGVVAARAVAAYAEMAGCVCSELLTTDSGDPVCADEPVSAVGEKPRWAATLTALWAASVGMNGVLGAEVAGVEAPAEPVPADDAAAYPATPKLVRDSHCLRAQA